MDRRTALSPQERQLRRRLRERTWSEDDLRWLLGHLARDTPTAILEEIHRKLQQTAADGISHGAQAPDAAKPTDA